MSITELKAAASRRGLMLIDCGDDTYRLINESSERLLDGVGLEDAERYFLGDDVETAGELAVPDASEPDVWTVEAAVEDCARFARVADKSAVYEAWTIGKHAEIAARKDVTKVRTDGGLSGTSGATLAEFRERLEERTGRELSDARITQLRKVYVEIPDPASLPASITAAIRLAYRADLIPLATPGMTHKEVADLIDAHPLPSGEQCPHVSKYGARKGRRCLSSAGHARPHDFDAGPFSNIHDANDTAKPPFNPPKAGSIIPTMDGTSGVKTGVVIPPKKPPGDTWKPTAEQKRGIEEGERLIRERSQALRDALTRAADKPTEYDDRVAKLLALAMGTDSEDEALASFQRARALHRKASS